MAVSGSVSNVRIAGVACAVPEEIVGNDVMSARFGAEQIAKFEKMVGVKERRVAGDGVCTSDLAYAAAQRLMAAGQWAPDDIDALVFVTQTPDYVVPATACTLQDRLGIKKDCFAFDFNLGCSGFVYGVHLVASLLQTQGIRKALLMGGDCPLKLVDPQDSASAPLFGDAGFAAVLARDESAGEIRYAFKTDGAGYRAIFDDNLARHGRSNPPTCEFVRMDGMDVFNFTINEVPDLIRAEMSAAQLTAENVDYLVLHQANRFVLKQVAMMTGFSMKKVPVSMDRFGNTSSASIPLTLCDLASRDQGVKKMVMSGFGVGLSWGTLIMDFDLSVCQPIIGA
ncbi:MAG: ketoacyl-ACP synthase III [bacterium]|nr:ketoacyl-ACP synthase III [Candidatus Colisoma equi]